VGKSKSTSRESINNAGGAELPPGGAQKAKAGLSHSKLFLFGGQAVVADAADFGAGDGNLNVAVSGDLLFELLVEARFEFADLAATETGDMDMVAWAVGFVVMAIAAEMEEVEFVDEALALEEIDGTVDGDKVDVGVDFLCATEDLVDVEVLLGGVHDLQNHATLAGETDAAFAKSVLQVARRRGSVDAFAGGNAMRGGRRHGASLCVSGHE
jgi:hypothetical protein